MNIRNKLLLAIDIIYELCAICRREQLQRIVRMILNTQQLTFLFVRGIQPIQ